MCATLYSGVCVCVCVCVCFCFVFGGQCLYFCFWWNFWLLSSVHWDKSLMVLDWILFFTFAHLVLPVSYIVLTRQFKRQLGSMTDFFIIKKLNLYGFQLLSSRLNIYFLFGETSRLIIKVTFWNIIFFFGG